MLRFWHYFINAPFDISFKRRGGCARGSGVHANTFWASLMARRTLTASMSSVPLLKAFNTDGACRIRFRSCIIKWNHCDRSILNCFGIDTITIFSAREIFVVDAADTTNSNPLHACEIQYHAWSCQNMFDHRHGLSWSAMASHRSPWLALLGHGCPMKRRKGDLLGNLGATWLVRLIF